MDKNRMLVWHVELHPSQRIAGTRLLHDTDPAIILGSFVAVTLRPGRIVFDLIA